MRRIAGSASRFMLICLFVLSSAVFFFTSPVQAQPTIMPSPLPDGQVGEPYTTTLIAAPLVGSCTWTVTSGSLPPGLTLDASSGTISGTPNTTGTFSFFVTVTDTVGPSPQQGFFIDITSPPLTFLTTSLPMATEGSHYDATLSVSGGTAPYTWTIVSGNLPSGLILSPTIGVISGAPASGTTGGHSFVIGVTDSSSPALSGQQSFSIFIEKGSFKPSVTIDAGLKAGETEVRAGATLVATLKGGESVSLTFDLGTSQVISVDPIVEHPSKAGVRYKAEQDKITVRDNSPDALFIYYTEYNIELETDPIEIVQLTGSGWYKEDYTLRASVQTEVSPEDKPGTQYRFVHWELPTGETISDKTLVLTVSAAGTCVAKYDTYYLLTLTSSYGDPEGVAWYKAGSTAEWSAATHEVRMPGILGVFGGKMKAVNSSGKEIMDGPKTKTINWEPDYTMPMILMPLALLLIIFGGYGLYLLWRGLQPRPVPFAPPPQPMPPPQTTVVMIGDKPKQAPQTTREQLMEQFGQLLQKYEDEITASGGTRQTALPPVDTIGEDKRLASPGAVPPSVVEAEFTTEEEATTCNYTSKKLLRTVVSNWRQKETRAVTAPAGDEKADEGGTGLATVWSRDIYQEWEIFTCSLSHGHKGSHDGSMHTAYSLLNTITEEKTLEPAQEPTPPETYHTNSMPQVEINANQILRPDQLPPETVS